MYSSIKVKNKKDIFIWVKSYKKSNKMNKLPNIEKGGGYILKYEAIYQRKTKRNLKIRVTEHFRDF